MENVFLKPEDIPTELALLITEFKVNHDKTTCDKPGCMKPHERKASFRLATPAAYDFFFCSEEHKLEAAARWGIKL